MAKSFSPLLSGGVNPEPANPLTIQNLMSIMDELDKNPPTPQEEAEAYATMFRFFKSEEGGKVLDELGISDI